MPYIRDISRAAVAAGFLALTVVSGALAAPAVERSVTEHIEIDRASDASEIAYVRLYGRDPSGVFPGHAFIEVFVPDGNGSWVGQGKLGLYPRSSIRSVYTFVTDSAVPGILSTHEADGSPSRAVSIKLDRGDLEKIETVITSWRNRDYDGYSSDCVTFVEEVARAIGLVVPPRDKTDYPRTSVIKIGQANR